MSASDFESAAPEDPRLRGWRAVPRPLRVVAVTSAGGTLLVVGAALLVLPGPGLLLIAAGTAVLATEFSWAAQALTRGRSHATRGLTAIRQWMPSSRQRKGDVS